MINSFNVDTIFLFSNRISKTKFRVFRTDAFHLTIKQLLQRFINFI